MGSARVKAARRTLVKLNPGRFSAFNGETASDFPEKLGREESEDSTTKTLEKLIDETSKEKEGTNNNLEYVEEVAPVGSETGLSNNNLEDFTLELEATTKAEDDDSSALKTPKERYFDYLNERCG